MGWMTWDSGDGRELAFGDEVWDIMGDALREIVEVYEREFDRYPYTEELLAILEWCGHTYELEGKLPLYPDDV